MVMPNMNHNYSRRTVLFFLLVLLGIIAEPCWSASDWLQKGTQHLRRGEYTEALFALNKAIAFDSHCATTYYTRGLALNLTDRHDRAIEEYSLAISLDPNYAAAYLRETSSERLKTMARQRHWI
jgi:tetratricopeptide (TPR) repeat protein